MITPLQALQRRTSLGWLQLTRERGRLLVAISGIAFADVLMFMQLGFQAALFESNTRFHQAMNADIVLLNPQAQNLNQPSTFARRRLFQAMNVPGVQSAEALYVNNVIWKHPETQKETTIRVMAFNPDRPAFNLPDVIPQRDRLKLPDYVLFDRGTRGNYQRTIAQIDRNQPATTEIDHRTITIAGTYQVGASFGADGTLLASDQTFHQLFPRRTVESVSVGLIQVEPGQDVEQVVKNLRSTLRSGDVKVMTLLEFMEFEKNYWQRNTPIGFIFSLGTVMGFIVGIIIVYQVLSTDVNAHLKEYATFKAMGYRNGYLLGVVFEEAIILAVLGFFPGTLIPIGLYQLTRNATNLPIAMTVARAILVLILTIAMCMISGAIATRKLQSADPADMF
jgi:putative ABC transport system permease protein